MTLRRFVVLDRDGTLVEERNYLSDPEALALSQGAAEGLRRLQSLGVGLVVVTNQSAIGRGLFDETRLDEIHARLSEMLAAEGIVLDGIYVCPHSPEAGCECRKPGTALLDRAGRELGFDPAESFVIGDKASDIELGRRAGATTILVRTGYGAEVESQGTARPDYVVADLARAARVIEEAISETARAAAAAPSRSKGER